MISDRLKRLVLEVLTLDDFPMTDVTIASQVPGWDSLSHVRILAAIEKEYGIRFRALEDRLSLFAAHIEVLQRRFRR